MKKYNKDTYEKMEKMTKAILDMIPEEKERIIEERKKKENDNK